MILIPQLLWTGVSIAYYSGNLGEMMTGALQNYSQQEQFYWSNLAMVGFGLGEIFGGFFIGWIVDRFGSKVAILCNLAIILTMFGITIGFIQVFEFNWMAWVMCFLWGCQDSGVNTQVQEMLGFEFDNASSEPFSIYNIFQCLACFIFQIIEAYVNDQPQYLYYTIALAVICVIANGMPYFFPFREHLANQNDIIGSLIGSKHGMSHVEPHHQEKQHLIENDVSAKFQVDQQPLDLPNSLVATQDPINKTSLLNFKSTSGLVAQEPQ